MNLSDSNQISHFYEQMIQRNLVVQQQLRQNDSLQLQILNKSNSSSSSASSTSSLLSISSKSQQASPNNSLISDKSESPDSKTKTNQLDTIYQNYMFNTFPYSFLANLSSSTPIMAQPKSHSLQQQNNILNQPNTFHIKSTTSSNQTNHNIINNNNNNRNNNNYYHHHHYHHSNQNIYRPNGKCEEAKPTHSYIGLIALAILSTPEKKLVLSDIYQWILDNYSYFHSRGSGWRNSIRHNLSLNDCFMKSGRSSNGKGHYWTIHPANMEDFMKGDFRRRRAQRRVRKSLGLTVPEEDEEDDDMLTPPSSLSPIQLFNIHSANSAGTNSLLINSQLINDKSKHNIHLESNLTKRNNQEQLVNVKSSKLIENELNSDLEVESLSEGSNQSEQIDIVNCNSSLNEKEEAKSNKKKRSFNMDSLLASDDEECSHKKIKFKYLVNNKDEKFTCRTWQSPICIKPIDQSANYQQVTKGKSVKTDQTGTVTSINRIESYNEDVEQWKSTFSKIMARSYKNNSISNQTNHSINGLVKK